MKKQSVVESPEFIDNTPQLVADSYFGEQALTRKQVVGNYLHNLDVFEQEHANQLAADLHRDDRPLAHTVVLIPVAAHQEAHNIENAIAQYAHQQTDQPFSVLLHPNAPLEVDPAATEATLAEIEKAKQTHPQLDIRTTPPEYYDRPTIGVIRRNLWNAALLLAHYEGAFDTVGNEVIGINNDIDIVRQSPRNIKHVQARTNKVQLVYERLGQPEAISRPHGIFVKHAYDPETPNTSRAVFWYDFCYAQLRSKGSYEAGLIIPFSYYAKHDGIQSDATLIETKSLIDGKNPGVIPGTILETSPRRFAQRLHDTNLLFNVWTESTFGANDECRTSKAQDISRVKLKSLIHGSLNSSLDYFFTTTVDRYEELFDTEVRWNIKDKDTALDEFTQALDRKKRLVINVLTRIIEVPHIAEIVERESKFDTRAVAERWWEIFEKANLPK